MVRITEVQKHTRADKKGIRAGDVLISINGNEITDVLDYRFYLAESVVVIEYERLGERKTVKIEKGEYDDIGLEFETPLMDAKHSCKNGCIFCFIDQNPEGLRESLYFKDDDSRLSFLHGNYITLTNMTDKDVERIIKMRFSPINISVHTTNPELRVKMMKNKRSGEVLRYLDDFKNAGLSMCGQIVLCREINDGNELLRSMEDLSKLFPNMGSVSVVPAGLTKFRDGLFPLSDFSKEEAGAVIDAVDAFAEKMLAEHGSRIFFAADEFYLKAERPLPNEEYYEEYPQIENGVGMLRSFEDEAAFALEDLSSELKSSVARTVSVATGVASYPTILKIAEGIMKICPDLTIKVYKITNNFFGESITVSGLLTGKDMREQLSDLPLGDTLYIPKNSLRHGEDVFLCGMTVDELSEALGTRVEPISEDGYEFVSSLAQN
ncbi:MAG: DUF512 domain-containing protein [Clostridia bacterium]|nr:DUF512 domain-containing protein [Clostridia bacterium]